MSCKSAAVGAAPAAAPAWSDSEIASQCAFVGHKTIALYERKISFIFDSAAAENAAFANKISKEINLDDQTTANLQSKHFDKDRYRLDFNFHSTPGFIGLFIRPLKWSAPLDRLPRQVSVSVKTFYGDESKAVKNFCSDALPFKPDSDGHALSRGWKNLIDVGHMQSSPTFVAHKRLVISVEITEPLNSDQMEVLEAPKFSIKKLASGMTGLSKLPNVRISFPDGQYLVNEQFITSQCKHFQIALSGDFSEATSKKRAFSEIAGQTPGNLTNASNVQIGADKKRSRVAPPTSQADVEDHEEKAGIALSQDSDFIPDFSDSSDESSSEEESDSDEPSSSQKKQPSASQVRVPVSVGNDMITKELKLSNFSVYTFKAFMGYLYTGTVTFKAIESSNNKVVPHKLRANSLLSDFWACSPKSLYRMADYFHVPELAKLCREAFEAFLSPSNVLKELADPCARLHKPLMETVEKYALKHWAAISALPDFAVQVESVMAHAESRETFIRILQKTGAAYKEK